MKPIKTLLLVCIFAFLFNACSSNKAQTKKYYRLTVPITSATVDHTKLKPLTLVVKRPTALSILGNRPIVATKEDQSLIQLSQNFWLESPKVLLQDRIKQWAQHHWQAVSYQTPSTTTHQTLETRILAFEKNQNQAIAALEFFLYDNNKQLIFNQRFNAIENITEDNYPAFVNAISLAIESIFTQFNHQLNQH